MDEIFFHLLLVGATRSGKSLAELRRILRLAEQDNCGIIAYDLHGTLARMVAMYLDQNGHTRRLLFDKLSDTDKTLGYELLPASDNPDAMQRIMENDERKQVFKEVLLSPRGMMDDAGSPIIREG